MHLSPKQGVFGAALAVVMLGTIGCGSDTHLMPVSERTVSALQSQSTPAYQRLAQVVALGLRDPVARAQFRAATATSTVKEGKLFLGGYLQDDGALLLDSMSRASGLSSAAIRALLDETGPMEIYLPVPEHRAQWRGGTDLIVAAQMDERETPFGVDLNGEPVVLSIEAPPAVPTVSIVPTESFKPDGQPYGRDMALATNTGPGTHATWLGLWVNEVHTGHDYEAWTRGDPEFEMYFQNGQTRQSIVCAEEDYSVEPYRWNMDSTNYYSPFLMAAENEMAESVPFVMAMYEDDDTRCVVKDDKDYIKLAVDALTNALSAYKALKAKQWQDGQWLVSVWNAYIAVKSIVNSNDEFVGITAGLNNIGTSAVTFQLKDQNMNNTGWVSLQWKYDTAH